MADFLSQIEIDSLLDSMNEFEPTLNEIDYGTPEFRNIYDKFKKFNNYFFDTVENNMPMRKRYTNPENFLNELEEAKKFFDNMLENKKAFDNYYEVFKKLKKILLKCLYNLNYI